GGCGSKGVSEACVLTPYPPLPSGEPPALGPRCPSPGRPYARERRRGLPTPVAAFRGLRDGNAPARPRHAFAPPTVEPPGASVVSGSAPYSLPLSDTRAPCESQAARREKGVTVYHDRQAWNAVGGDSRVRDCVSGLERSDRCAAPDCAGFARARRRDPRGRTLRVQRLTPRRERLSHPRRFADWRPR